MVRFPDGMRDELKALAEQEGRSLNAEIVARLETSLREAASMEKLRRDLAYQEGISASLQATIDVFIRNLAGADDNQAMLTKIEFELRQMRAENRMKAEIAERSE
jgi:hypothetical protein